MKKTCSRTTLYILAAGLCFWLSSVHVTAASDEGLLTGEGVSPETEVLSAEEKTEPALFSPAGEDTSDPEEEPVIEPAPEEEHQEPASKPAENASEQPDDTEEVNPSGQEGQEPAALPVAKEGTETPENAPAVEPVAEPEENPSEQPGDAEEAKPSEQEGQEPAVPAVTGKGTEKPEDEPVIEPAPEKETEEPAESKPETPKDTEKRNPEDKKTADQKKTETGPAEDAESEPAEEEDEAETVIETVEEELSPVLNDAQDQDAAEASDEVKNKLPDLIEGVAYIPFQGKDYPVRYLYSDSYFSGPSTTGGFNYELAAVSSILSNASAISRRSVNATEEELDSDVPPYSQQSKNIQTMLRELGFENIRYNEDYEKSGTPFTTGILCATKKVTIDGKEYTLLGIFPRSFGYTLEWANNGEYGGEGDAEGPALNVNTKILPFVKDYLTEAGITGDLKLWSTGMSRGGGMAMLTTAYIDDMLDENGKTSSLFGIDGLCLDKDDIYTYAFGTPNWGHTDNTRVNGAESEKKDIYNNIHNFAAEYDLLYKMLTGSWGLEHYGSDEIMTTDEAKKKLGEMMNEYAALLGTDIKGLVKTGFFEERNGDIIYKPLDPDKTYRYQGEDLDLGTFLDRYMKNMTAGVDRKEDFAANQEGMLALLSVFLGQRDKTATVIDNIKPAAADTFVKILEGAIAEFKKDEDTKSEKERFNAALKYLKEQLAAGNLTAAILTESFEKSGVEYKYDYFERTEAEDGEVVSLYDAYIAQVLRLALNIGLADPGGLVPMYQASGNLWPAHDSSVYASWLNAYSSESDYLLNPLTEGEKWGYRMVYLPDSKEISISVYKGTEISDSALDGTVTADGYERTEGFDPYVHIGVDLNGKKVLYLRADKEYVLVMNPQKKQASTNGLEIDEFEYEYSYKIFDPEYHIDKDDHTVDLSQTLKLIESNGHKLSDQLILKIGSIGTEKDKEEDKDKVSPLKAGSTDSAESTTEEVVHHAEYYLLTKLIELGGAVQDNTGGKVNGLDYYLLKLMLNSDGTSVPGMLSASPLSGYRFVGWFTPDGTLVSESLDFTKNFTFNDSSALYYARFELIPDVDPEPKPEPKPDPKPDPSGDDSSDDTPSDDRPSGNTPSDDRPSGNTPSDGADIRPAVISIPVEITLRKKIPNTSDDPLTGLWAMLFASITAAGASMYLLKKHA